MKKRYFPCWVCKGQGILETGEFVDGQQVSPDLDCAYCEGEGLIEIGGRIHRRIRAIRIGMDIMSFKNPNFECSTEELIALGEKALKLI